MLRGERRLPAQGDRQAARLAGDRAARSTSSTCRTRCCSAWPSRSSRDAEACRSAARCRARICSSTASASRDRQQSLDLIRAASVHVDAFLPVSDYYRDYMPGYLGIPREKMRLVPLGINLDGYAPRAAPRAASRSRSATSRASRRRRGCTCWRGLSPAARRGRASARRGSSPPATSRPSTRPTSTSITRQMREWGLGGPVRVPRRARSRAEDRVPAEPRRAVGAGDLRRAEGHVPARGDGQRRAGRAAAARRVSRDCRDDRRRPARRRRTTRRRSPTGCWRCGAIRRAPRRSARAGAAGVREHYSVGRMAEAAEAVYRERRSRADSTSTESMLIAIDVSKSYPTPRGALPILADVSLTLERGDAGGDHGAVGQRQEHAALHPRRARAAVVRHGDARRPGSASRSASASRRRSATGASASCSRITRCCRSARCSRTSWPRRSSRRRPNGTRARRRGARARAARAGRPRRPPRSSAGRAVRRREAARRRSRAR